jgi:GH24 family phage-related lysozyme (muramidase)
MSMNDDLKTSKEGLELIEKWEGCVLTPYRCIAGKRTIGIGHVIKPNENYPDGSEITKESAFEILAEDVKICEDEIKKHIKSKLTQNQFDALVSFGFNCGTGVYTNSGVARAINDERYEEVPDRLKDWSKAKVNGVSVTVKGLLNRRIHEGEVFSGKNSSSNFIIDDLQTAWSKNRLIEVQTELSRLKLYDSTVDGLWGAKTEAGIKEFARRHNLTIADPKRGVSNSFVTKLRNEK